MKQKQNTTMVSSSSPFEKKAGEATEPKKKTKSTTRKKSDAPAYAKPTPRLEEMPEELTNEPSAMEEIVPNEEVEAPVVEKKHSLFGRRSEKHTKKTEARLSVLEQVCKKSGLAEDDIHMMLELGYENELGRLVGYENLKHVKSEILKQSGHETPHRYSTSFGYRGNEFVSNAAKDSVLAAYVHDRKLLILRLLLPSLCAFLLFFIDQPALFGGTPLEAFANGNRVLLDLFGMLLLIPVFLLSKKQIRAGMHSLFHFSPTP